MWYHITYYGDISHIPNILTKYSAILKHVVEETATNFEILEVVNDVRKQDVLQSIELLPNQSWCGKYLANSDSIPALYNYYLINF